MGKNISFFYGNIYEIWLPIYPVQAQLSYYILDVDTGHKKGVIQYGYDRELEVGRNSRIIWCENNKTKVIKIPFVYNTMEKRWIFDFPKYLKEKKLKFKLYKRNLETCGGYKWDSPRQGIFCRNGGITWGSERCIDYWEFWLLVEFYKDFPVVNGKEINRLSIDKATNRTDTEEVLSCFKNWFVGDVNITGAEFKRLLEEIGFHSNSHFGQLEYTDGTKEYFYEI